MSVLVATEMRFPNTTLFRNIGHQSPSDGPILKRVQNSGYPFFFPQTGYLFLFSWKYSNEYCTKQLKPYVTWTRYIAGIYVICLSLCFMFSRTTSLLDNSVPNPQIISPMCVIGKYFIHLSIRLKTQVKSTNYKSSSYVSVSILSFSGSDNLTELLPQ